MSLRPMTNQAASRLVSLQMAVTDSEIFECSCTQCSNLENKIINYNKNINNTYNSHPLLQRLLRFELIFFHSATCKFFCCKFSGFDAEISVQIVEKHGLLTTLMAHSCGIYEIESKITSH